MTDTTNVFQNPFDSVTAAVQNGNMLQRAIRNQADSLAYLLTGNLRHANTYNLTRLKKELRDFNMHTGEWK